nr:TIGR02270 family protein [Pyxidicoccus fallax]
MPRIAWDVLEEHLDEAAFLWRQRERSLRSPEETLDDVASGDERRLLAHLDALCIGGGAVTRRLLLPSLEGPDETRIPPAAWVLLESGEADLLPAVLDVLAHGDDSQRKGIQQAARLCTRQELDSALRGLLPDAAPAVQRVLLAILGFRQVDPGPILEALAGEDDPLLAAACLDAARFTTQPRADRLIQRGLESPHPQVRDASILTGLIHGYRAAWARCVRVVRDQEPQGELALLLLAVGGHPRHEALLLQALATPALHTQALWALGFSGRLCAAEALLEVLKAEPSWLAADAFRAITGFPLASALLRGETEEEEAVLDDGPPALPWRVNVSVVEDWWKEERRRFAPDARYLHGQPWSPDALLLALAQAPMCHRSVFAMELAVRSQGTANIETAAWSHTQRAGLSRARERRWTGSASPFEALLRR